MRKRNLPPYLQDDFNYTEGFVSLDGNKYDAMFVPVWSVSSPNKKGIRRIVITFGRTHLSNPNVMIGMYIRSAGAVERNTFGWGAPTSRYLVVNDKIYVIDFDGRSRSGKFILKAGDMTGAMGISSINFVFTKMVAKISNVGDQCTSNNS